MSVSSARSHLLGHVISSNGIAPDPAKISNVEQWPTPTLATQVQQFLGLANYYHSFAKDFACRAKPLHQLTEQRQLSNGFQNVKLLLNI